MFIAVYCFVATELAGLLPISIIILVNGAGSFVESFQAFLLIIVIGFFGTAIPCMIFSLITAAVALRFSWPVVVIVAPVIGILIFHVVVAMFDDLNVLLSDGQLTRLLVFCVFPALVGGLTASGQARRLNVSKQ